MEGVTEGTLDPSTASMQFPSPMALPRSLLGFVLQKLTPGEAMRLAMACKEMRIAVTEQAEGYWGEQAVRLGWARCVRGHMHVLWRGCCVLSFEHKWVSFLNFLSCGVLGNPSSNLTWSEVQLYSNC
jgi:hypothetical protein